MQQRPYWDTCHVHPQARPRTARTVGRTGACAPGARSTSSAAPSGGHGGTAAAHQIPHSAGPALHSWCRLCRRPGACGRTAPALPKTYFNGAGKAPQRTMCRTAPAARPPAATPMLSMPPPSSGPTANAPAARCASCAAQPRSPARPWQEAHGRTLPMCCTRSRQRRSSEAEPGAPLPPERLCAQARDEQRAALALGSRPGASAPGASALPLSSILKCAAPAPGSSPGTSAPGAPARR